MLIFYLVWVLHICFNALSIFFKSEKPFFDDVVINYGLFLTMWSLSDEKSKTSCVPQQMDLAMLVLFLLPCFLPSVLDKDYRMQLNNLWSVSGVFPDNKILHTWATALYLSQRSFSSNFLNKVK